MNLSSINSIATEVRGLILDASFHSETGHMGVPLACADILAYLYGHFLNYSIKNVSWLGRDRFILSSGHAVLAQYACLHMAGFPLPLLDLKNHRQIHSTASSHPQYNLSLGIEASTGADGQGIAYAVGNALGIKKLSLKLPIDKRSLLSNKIITLAGDGCLMEGVSYEACALAGHWKLNNLIVIYNADNVSLDGNSDLTCSENINMRFMACNWNVIHIDGHDIIEMDKVFSNLRKDQEKPTLIVAKTTFAKGLLKQTSINDHKNTLTEKELFETKKQLGLSLTPFHIPDEIYSYFTKLALGNEESYQLWITQFNLIKQNDTEIESFFSLLSQIPSVETLINKLQAIDSLAPISGRDMGHNVLNALCNDLPLILACSADTSNSDRTYIANDSYTDIFTTRNIKFGVREFAMGAIAIGLAQIGFIPVVGCYLVFSDYMRNAIRAAALMNLKILFHFTHDSVFVGQDGPTHQPIEQLSSYRAMPNLHVVRPGTIKEMNACWVHALMKNGPTAFILSRQTITIPLDLLNHKNEMIRGGYIFKDSHKPISVILVATGSELAKAIEVSTLLEQKGKYTKIISLPCWETLIEQPADYQKNLFGPYNCPIVVIEAASIDPWSRLNQRTILFSINKFGHSATIPQLEKYFNLRSEDIVAHIMHYLKLAVEEMDG